MQHAFPHYFCGGLQQYNSRQRGYFAGISSNFKVMKPSFKSEKQTSANKPSSSKPDSIDDDPSGNSEVRQQNDTSDTSNYHPNAAAVIVPDDNCIVFGRGKGANNRPANKRMRVIIDSYKDQYVAAERGEKCRVVRKLHDELVERGMRFLKQVEGGTTWVEVDTNAAILKVGHALRSAKQDKQQQKSVRPRQPSVSNNSQSVQEAQVAPHCEPVQVSATALIEANVLAQTSLTNTPPLPVGPSLMLDSVLGGLGASRFAAAGTSYPSLSLENSRLMEMEMNRLLSVSQLSMGVAAAPYVDLSGLSTSQLLLLVERQRSLRQMMLNDTSIWPRHFPGAPP
ncbi:unnamed protein product [Cylindrotheca closterium]|uniref:DUF6824 domain-containing protein n=1 Tax=Cylindrotheca closterium TaxID=2856 RepID=A0AAD2CPS8_9STRA|nr:unnamed protein product [Cylindrotheca closterium]